MNSFSRTVSLFVFSTVIFCSAVNAQKQPLSAAAVADSGTFDGKLYTNSTLGFTVLVPGGWTIFTNNQNAAAIAAGQQNTKVAAADLPQKERDDLARSISNTQILFQASSLTKIDNKSSALLSCGVEKLTTPATKEQYLETNKKLILLDRGVQVVKDIYTVTIGGMQFVGFDVAGASMGKAFRQKYLATVRKGVALFFVSTLLDDKNDTVVDASIKTLKLRR